MNTCRMSPFSMPEVFITERDKRLRQIGTRTRPNLDSDPESTIGVYNTALKRVAQGRGVIKRHQVFA